MIANSNWLFCRVSPDRWPSLETPVFWFWPRSSSRLVAETSTRRRNPQEPTADDGSHWIFHILSMLKAPTGIPLWDCNRLQWLEMSVVISHGFNPFHFHFLSKKTAMGNSAVEVCHFSCFDSPVFPWNPMFPIESHVLMLTGTICQRSPGAWKDLVWLDTTRSFGDIRLKAPHNIATGESMTTNRWWCLHGKSLVFYHGAVLKTEESPKSSWIMLNPIYVVIVTNASWLSR